MRHPASILRAAFLLVLLGAARSSAEPCPPRAELQGDAELVAKVETILRARGFADRTAARCFAARAHIVRAEHGLALVLVDELGRSGSFALDGVADAAALIESFARVDLSMDAWPTAPPRPASPPPIPVSPAKTNPAIVAASSPPTRFLATAAFELARGSGEWWPGAGVRGCLPVGALCPGLALSVSARSAKGSPAIFVSGHASYAPSRRGFSLEPGLGVGVGRVEQDPCSTIDGATDCGGTWVLRTTADLHGAARIARGLRVDVGLALDLDRKPAPPGAAWSARARASLGLGVRLP